LNNISKTGQNTSWPAFESISYILGIYKT